MGLQGPEHLQAHLSRLEAAAEEPVPWLSEVIEELHAWAGSTPAALRLRLDARHGQLWARRESLPATPHPYRLLPLPHPLPPLGAPRRKGLDGRWEAAPLAAARAFGAEDALLLWPDGTLAESAIATVAWERGRELLLPPPGGRVAGLGERLTLPGWAAARGLSLHTSPIHLAELGDGRLWCVNALRGVWPAELHLPRASADPLP